MRLFAQRVVVLGLALAATALPAPAQDARFLAIPAGDVLTCRINSRASVSLPGYVTYQFDIGRAFPPARSIAVAFDSAGRPLTFRENLSVLDSSNVMDAQLATATFLAEGRVTGLAITARLDPKDFAAVRDSTAVRRLTRPLSEEQQRKIQLLVEWLWTHRCGRSTGRSTGDSERQAGPG